MRTQFIVALALLTGAPVWSAALQFKSGYPVVQVLVNGQGPYRMLVDTGAQSSVLRPSIAEKLRLRPVGAVEVHATTLRGVAPVYEANEIRVDQTYARNVEVIAMNLPIDGIDGFLGQSFLSQMDYLLNYADRTIILDPDGQMEESITGTGLPIVDVAGRPAVRVNGETWVLDSGASHLILFRRPPDARSIGSARMTTTQGTRLVERVFVERLQVGPIVLKSVEAAVVPGAGGDVEGLLPLSLLRSVYVNNRKQYVLLEPRPCGLSASAPTKRSGNRGE